MTEEEQIKYVKYVSGPSAFSIELVDNPSLKVQIAALNSHPSIVHLSFISIEAIDACKDMILIWLLNLINDDIGYAYKNLINTLEKRSVGCQELDIIKRSLEKDGLIKSNLR